MGKVGWFLTAVGVVVAWQGSELLWVATAPAMAFQAADFVKPGNPTGAEREAMFGNCMAKMPSGMSPERRLSICTCQKDRLTKTLNRAEYIYLLHLSGEEKRQAYSALKGLAAAHRPQEEIQNAGRRGSDAIRETAGVCLQSSLTDDDMRRIRNSLEQRGIAPSSGTNRLTDE